MKLSTFLFCAVASTSLVQAGPIYFFVTGHVGAQTQIDINHSTDFFAPSIGSPAASGGRVSVADLDPTFDWLFGGGEFLLKDGPGTGGTHSTPAYDITFSLFQD